MTQPIATLEQLAFREGDPREWGGELGGAEYTWTIESRILGALGLSHSTDEIRAAAFAESDRQKELIYKWKQEQELLRHERDYKARVKDKVTGLADAIEQFVASGDRSQLEEDLYAAFRSETEQLQRELNQTASYFRPIG